MELVRKSKKIAFLGKNNKIYYIYYSIFWCSFCSQEVEKRTEKGKKQKSCGCQTLKEISKANKGKIRTEEQRQKISKTRIKNGVGKGEKNPNYGKHLSNEIREKIRKGNKGKIVSEETRKKQSEAQKGRVNSRIYKFGKNHPMYGKNHTEETRQLMKDKHADFSLENHPNWQSGRSFEIYPKEFNKELKNFILDRDNYQCQDPNCKYLSDILDCHHIDYDKKNNNSENLILLCRNCHMKTVGKNNRQYFIEFYQNIMMDKLMGCLL